MFMCFSIELDDTTAGSDTDHSSNDWFEIVTELLFMDDTKGTTTGEGLYQELSSLSWNNLINVTTDGFRNLTSIKIRLVILIFSYTTHREA